MHDSHTALYNMLNIAQQLALGGNTAAVTRLLTGEDTREALAAYRRALAVDEDTIALEWWIGDVQEVRPDLDDEQARAVLARVLSNHDATIGVTWDTLEIVAHELYPQAEPEC